MGGFSCAGGGAHGGTDGKLRRELLADGFVEKAFRELQCFRGSGGAFFAELGAAGPEAGFVDEFVVDVETEGFVGSDEGGREQQAGRGAAAGAEGQERGDDAGDDAAAWFGKAELGGWGGDNDVAGQDQACAAGDGGAVHRGDDRFGEVDHFGDDFAVGLGVRAEVLVFLRVGECGRGLHFLQVHAGAERGASAGEDDGSDSFFKMQIVESFDELGEHRAREGVAAFRPVEHDCAHGAGYLHVDGVAWHKHQGVKGLTQRR